MSTDDTNHDWSYEDYQSIHEFEAGLAQLMRRLEGLEDREANLNKKMLDLEAERFADSIERDVDRETWRGIYAAYVGRELEEIADMLTAAAEADRRGEGIGRYLFEIQGAVDALIADIATGKDGEQPQAGPCKPV